MDARRRPIILLIVSLTLIFVVNLVWFFVTISDGSPKWRPIFHITAAVILLICINILFFQLRGRGNRRRE
jgi:hypothetical protein